MDDIMKKLEEAMKIGGFKLKTKEQLGLEMSSMLENVEMLIAFTRDLRRKAFESCDLVNANDLFKNELDLVGVRAQLQYMLKEV